MPYIRINNEEIYVNNLYYISPTGNDNNDGSYDNPFKTYKKAEEIASSGDGIEILPGTHNWNMTLESSNKYIRSIYWANNYVIRDNYSCLYDNGKKLFVYGTPNKTIVNIKTVSGQINSLFCLRNSETQVAGLIINFEVTDSGFFYHYTYNGNYQYHYLYAYVNGLIAFECGGKVANVYIDYKGNGVTDWGHANTGLTIENCNIKTNGRINTNVSSTSGGYYNYYYCRRVSFGTFTIRNSIIDNPFYMPTSVSNLLKTPTEEYFDFDKLNIPDDAKNKGATSIYNPDLTRSHIGVLGGLYSWRYKSLVDMKIRSYKYLEIINRNYVRIKSFKLSILKCPTAIINFDNYSYNNLSKDDSQLIEMTSTVTIQNSQYARVLDLSLFDIPDGISMLKVEFSHTTTFDTYEILYLLKYKGKFFLGKSIQTLLPKVTDVSPRRVYVNAKSDKVQLNTGDYSVHVSRDGGNTFIEAINDVARFNTEGGDNDKEIIVIVTSYRKFHPDRVGYIWT